MSLPPCGLYRTRAPIGQIPAGRLVFFHNHGEPGPGVYLPEKWEFNRAIFSERGVTLTDEAEAELLEPLLEEGLYVVEETFECCDAHCVTYEVGQLVQLGYDRDANPLLFRPVWTSRGLSIPEIGQLTEPDRLASLQVVYVDEEGEEETPVVLH